MTQKNRKLRRNEGKHSDVWNVFVIFEKVNLIGQVLTNGYDTIQKNTDENKSL